MGSGLATASRADISLKFCWENFGYSAGSFAEQTYYPSAVCCWYAPPAEKNATLRWEQW
jgi:hypothetical protein